jgi:hypothetical protein
MNPDLKSKYNAKPGRCTEFEVLYLSATWLPQLLAHLPNIKHLRFYPLSPDFFEANKPELLKYEWATPAEVMEWDANPPAPVQLMREAMDADTSWKLERLVQYMGDVDIPISRITMPLSGNQSSSFGMNVIWKPTFSTLTHVSVNLAGMSSRTLGAWLEGLKNLEFLDLALSSYQDDEHAFVPVGRIQKWTWWWPEYFDNPDFHARLPKVREFRLMADNQYCFAEKDILLVLGIFPNLKELDLAHILLGVGR